MQSDVKTADIASLERRLRRIETGVSRSALDELLQRRIPIHIGGMSDPLPPVEAQIGTTRRALEVLRDLEYPAAISTKSCLGATRDYLRILRDGRFAVQFSISTLDDELGRSVDAGAPHPSERLRAMSTLAEAGVRVAVRIQPVLPGREAEVHDLISVAAAGGASHVAVEHLKLPIEQDWSNKSRLDRALGMNVGDHYRRKGAVRVGREWILPASDRIPRMLSYRGTAHTAGLRFGAADNDLLHFSDGLVCCSGADLLGLGRGFEYNYLAAIRRRTSDNKISISGIENVWRPSRSIGMYLNSSSRPLGNTIEAYVRSNWNGRPNGNSPLGFFGVEATAELDASGMKIYRLSNEAETMGVSRE